MEPETFAELGLSPKVLTAIESAGYATPTPIQIQAIPIAVTGRDVLGIAQTGTGKTASFVLPMITRLETGRARARMPRSLILAPTRELAAQVAQSFEKYGIHHKLSLALLIGGVSFDEQDKKLDRGVDVLIATPGRMLDHFQRGRLMLMGVEILVIDEADRMLDMGFIPDIERICKLLPPKRQTLFFSATMPPEITRLVDQFLTDPVRIEVARPATAAQTITQRFRYCREGDDWAKREALREIIRSEPIKNAIIFCNRKKDVAILLKSLLKHGFNAGALHGDMDQSARTATLDAFRAGKIMFLAASDVAARGLDIPAVSHVFNFDVPWAGDDYVHRIGRTGRAGLEGIATTLVGPDDLKLAKEIEKITGTAPVWMGEAPTEEEIAEAGKRRKRGRGGRVEARGDKRGAGSAREGRGEARGEGRRGGRGEPRRERFGEGRRDGPRERLPDMAASAQTMVEPAFGAAPVDPGLATAPPVRDIERVREPRREGQRNRLPRPSGEDTREAGGNVRGGDGRGGDGRGRADRPRRVPVADAPGLGEQPVIEPRGEHRRSEEAQTPRRTGEGRSPRRDHPPEARGGADVRREREPRHQEPRAPEHRGREREQRPSSEPAVGFQDNVPAFLRRSVRPAKAVTE